jgi:hypothetical protein
MSDGWTYIRMATRTRARVLLLSRRDRGRFRAKCGGVRRELQVLEAEMDGRAFPLSLD